MRARDHTERMLGWWHKTGVSSVDLALRRPGDLWLWHRRLPLGELPRFLAWARAENLRRAEVYARPARGASWPVVFLDDLSLGKALELAQQRPALCVRTSPEGGCQLWLRCGEALDEEARYHLQRTLARLLDADPGSVSGEHLGRLAGFRNWKRQGPWVNVLAATHEGDPLIEQPLLAAAPGSQKTVAPSRRGSDTDTSDSGREWGWVCGALEAGCAAEWVYRHLVERARPRRGRDAERYARHTIERAVEHLR